MTDTAIPTTPEAGDGDELGHPLADVPAPGPWARRGRCRTAPPSLFFPERGDDLRQARAICKGCPVVDQCAAYAIPHRDLRGVWGGLSEKERRLLRRNLAVDDTEPAEAVSGPAQAAAGALYAVLEQLALHPGNWAKIGHFQAIGSAHTMASLLRTGRKPLPDGEWAFEGRRNPAGGSDLYARCEPSPSRDPLSRPSGGKATES